MRSRSAVPSSCLSSSDLLRSTLDTTSLISQEPHKTPPNHRSRCGVVCGVRCVLCVCVGLCVLLWLYRAVLCVRAFRSFLHRKTTPCVHSQRSRVLGQTVCLSVSLSIFLSRRLSLLSMTIQQRPNCTRTVKVGIVGTCLCVTTGMSGNRTMN